MLPTAFAGKIFDPSLLGLLRKKLENDLLFTFDLFHSFVYRVDPTILRVVAGEHSLRTDSGLEQNRNVVSYTMHENYDA